MEGDKSICPACCMKSDLSVEDRIKIALATTFDRSWLCVICGRHYARVEAGYTVYLNEELVTE